MKLSELNLTDIVLIAVVIVACILIVLVFLAPFFGITMGDDLKAFAFNLFLLLVGGGSAGFGALKYAEARGAAITATLRAQYAEQLRALTRPDKP